MSAAESLNKTQFARRLTAPTGKPVKVIGPSVPWRGKVPREAPDEGDYYDGLPPRDFEPAKTVNPRAPGTAKPVFGTEVFHLDTKEKRKGDTFEHPKR